MTSSSEEPANHYRRVNRFIIADETDQPAYDVLRVLASEYDGNELGKMSTMAHLVVGIQGRSVHGSRPGKLGWGLATVSS